VPCSPLEFLSKDNRGGDCRFHNPLQGLQQNLCKSVLHWPGIWPVIPLREIFMKYAFATAGLAAAVLAVSPASAAKMNCSGDNMTKTSAAMMTMPYGPNRMAMDKEMGMANTEMSKGNMKGACSHYMKAQKMSAMKSGR
jgi:hypothetical protein